MKKFFFLILILLPTILAEPTLKLQNEDIQPGETILATINTTGEFTTQIQNSQIKFYEGRKEKDLESGIYFYNNTHYLYIYTNIEQNLTLKIENILYKEKDQLKSITLEKNLTIKEVQIFDEESNETYTKIIKIKPGYIFTSQIPTIKLTNVGTSVLNFTFKEEEVSLQPLSSKEVSFTPEKTFSLTTISTYKDFQVPTIYLKANNESFTPTYYPDLRSPTSLILLELFTQNQNETTLELFNFGDENITDMAITHNTSFVEIQEPENMLPRATQNLTIKLSPQEPGHFQDTIKISYKIKTENFSLEIPFSIFVLPKGSPIEEFEKTEETCEELSGQVCETGYLCNGTATFTGDSKYCCLASCVEKEPSSSGSSSSFKWLAGIVILIILALAANYFYKKQKRLAPETPTGSLEKTAQDFEKRLSGNIPKRTTGNLTRN